MNTSPTQKNGSRGKPLAGAWGQSHQGFKIFWRVIPLQQINQNIQKLLDKPEGVKQAVATSLYYHLKYRLSGDTKSLKAAVLCAENALSENKQSANLTAVTALLYIELNEHENAKQTLNKLNQYKAHFKANNPNIYGLLLFLLALNEIKANKNHSATKHIKALNDFADTQNHYIFPLFQGVISLLNNNYLDAGTYFTLCYNRGCRSSFFFGYLYEFFGYELDISSYIVIFRSFINWSMAHSVDVSPIINYYQKYLLNAYFFDSGSLYKIYEVYKLEAALKEICQNLIINHDYSEQAYKYYREAEARQIQIPQLCNHLVKSAYKNGIEDISRYSLESFFSEADKAIDPHIAPFVYHLLLNNRRLKDNRIKEILQTQRDKVVKYAVYCLRSGKRGRYYNSMYKFLLESASVDASLKECEHELITVLKDDLFAYTVTTINESVTHIWVTEKEKRDVSYCEVLNGKARVYATSDTFSYICYNSDDREIVETPLTIKRIVENADFWLYMFFFSKGHISVELLIALTRTICQKEKPDAADISILQYAIPLKGISEAYKMQLCVAMGNIFYAKGDKTRAIEYYSAVTLPHLNDKHLEKVVTAYIETKNLDKAVEIIQKRAHRMHDGFLFAALKRVYTQEGLGKKVASSAYKLILRGKYDKRLLDIVIANYSGSISNWEALVSSLAEQNIQDIRLYEIILKNSLYTHSFTQSAEKAFAQIYKKDFEHQLIGIFTYYSIYEIIINNARPQYETIDVLEKMFNKYGDKLLAYALCTVYIEHELQTKNSVNILESAARSLEADGFMLPVFKKLKDNGAKTPYIEKIEPFIYKGSPNKDIYFYYKTDEDEKFSFKKMKYFRFGLYTACITLFYGEKATYYFSEEMSTGSIETKEETVENNREVITESNDKFFVINNALVYERMFKHEQVEEIITQSLKDLKKIRGKTI